MEHRIVMSDLLGRPLLPGETVHHKTGGRAGRSNNDPSNLELWTSRHPPGHRVDDVVTDCIEMLTHYAPHLLACHPAPRSPVVVRQPDPTMETP